MKHLDDPKEIHELVLKMVKEFHDIIKINMSEIDTRQSWLIMSRVINTIFYVHYRNTISFAEKEVEKVENDSRSN